MTLKTRIKVVVTDDWVKYIPQYKGWIFWHDYDENEVMLWSFREGRYELWSKEMAEDFIDIKIELYEDEKVEVENLKSMKVSYEDYPE